MIIKFFTMGGYGLFVWLSFAITFVACGLVYFITKKTLNKYEKDFIAELNKLPNDKKVKVLGRSRLINQILISRKKLI